MSLRAGLGKIRRGVMSSLYRREVTLAEAGPFVSFAFDDFPRSACTAGGPILRDLGVRATYYAAMGLKDAVNELGEQFHLDDLYSVVAEGHELGHHTFTHISSRAVPLAKFEEDLRKGYRAIQEVVGESASPNFAYPFGDVTLATKRTVGGKGLPSCRGIYGGSNGPRVDLNLLRANSLYGDAGQLKNAEQLLDNNERQRGWLIFYTHDVRTNPSRYGCSPELLEATVRLAAKRGARILPVAEVLACCGVTADPRQSSVVVRD